MKKLKLTCLKGGSKYTSGAVSISCIVIKKREDKLYWYESVQEFYSEYSLRKTYPWFPTALTKTNLEMYSFTKNLFRLNIFAIYFSLKLIFFTVRICHLIKRKKVTVGLLAVFYKRNWMNEYPGIIVVCLYQTLDKKYVSIKKTRKQNSWTNLKRKEMKKLCRSRSD